MQRGVFARIILVGADHYDIITISKVCVAADRFL